MRIDNHHAKTTFILVILCSVLAALLLGTLPAAGHGPKGHGGNDFTHLSAAKKGIELYDKLLAQGKLNETWEMALTDIQVFSRTRENMQEVVVQFTRKEGDPRSVYIFFNSAGEYSGSNFSGK
jgi:hypothetical protein